MESAIEGIVLAFALLYTPAELALAGLSQQPYDPAGQLSAITYMAGAVRLGDLAYDYDLTGHRDLITGSFARTALPAAMSGAAYDADNRLVDVGSASLSYDANGNTLSDSKSTYGWNARGELVIMGGVQFAYDGIGRRTGVTISAVTTNYLYDGVNPVQEQVGAAPVLNLLTAGVDEYLARTDSSGGSMFLTDAMGSTIAMTDQAAKVTTQFTYDPFGGTSSTGAGGASNLNFTGRELDTTGLYYYRARYYNPQLERFVSEDPLRFMGGVNFYRYALDAPTMFKDASGLTVTCYYGQNTGMLVCFDDSSHEQVVDVHGYAGGNEGQVPRCVNNSDCQYTEDTGPLPWGVYKIGAATNRMGPLSLPLTPVAGTPDNGRPGGYYMHGCKRPGQTCSQGCVVVPPGARQTINDSGGGTLMVSPNGWGPDPIYACGAFGCLI